jgi:hypothetical protein
MLREEGLGADAGDDSVRQAEERSQQEVDAQDAEHRVERDAVFPEVQDDTTSNRNGRQGHHQCRDEPRSRWAERAEADQRSRRRDDGSADRQGREPQDIGMDSRHKQGGKQRQTLEHDRHQAGPVGVWRRELEHQRRQDHHQDEAVAISPHARAVE